MNLNSLILPFSLLLAIVSFSAPIAMRQEEVRNATLCELSKASIENENSVIRVAGTYYHGFEVSRLLDSTCKDVLTWVEFDENYRKNTDDSVIKELDRLIARAREEEKKAGSIGDYYAVEVTWIARFNQLNRFGGRGGFGHMNRYDSELTVLRIESVKELTKR